MKLFYTYSLKLKGGKAGHNVGKLRFFLDRDAGLLGACLGAYADRVGDRTADIVIVDIDKHLKVDERQRKHAEAKRWFQTQIAANPDLSPTEVPHEDYRGQDRGSSGEGDR